VRALTASEIIQLWETAYRFHPIDQALSILQLVMPEHNRDELANLPLGRRNTLLLALRQTTFGDALPGKSLCPHCGETVEFELSCKALVANATATQLKHLSRDGYSIKIRPLNSFDLAAAASTTTVQQARELLLQRCVAEALYQNKAIDADTLPAAIEKSITETALASDPQAEMLLDLNCPACQHSWQTVLDISQLMWLEISARAQRLLMEVHQLATTYSWTESEILKLSPTRRAAYLQMVTA
jgi:hypothetical protein